MQTCYSVYRAKILTDNNGNTYTRRKGEYVDSYFSETKANEFSRTESIQNNNYTYWVKEDDFLYLPSDY